MLLLFCFVFLLASYYSIRDSEHHRHRISIALMTNSPCYIKFIVYVKNTNFNTRSLNADVVVVFRTAVLCICAHVVEQKKLTKTITTKQKYQIL